MKTKERTIWIIAVVLAIGLLVSNAAAQSDPYPKMAPVEQYLMDKNAEIQLARSAAPDSISRDATVLVLGRQGYETAVDGKNGFVCMVERSWMGMFDWPEFWNRKVRAADCLNPQAARSILPIVSLRARMVMSGRSKAEIVSAVKAAFEKKQLPSLESGAMVYMMSKSAYLTDEGDHTVSHVMFYTSVENAKDWGSGAEGSPIMSSPYWFMSPKEQSQMQGLPPILVFLVMVPNWSDGTPAATEMRAHHSGDPKLDRAIEKANSEFIVAMKTGDAATIAAPYTENASFITFDGACIQGRTEIEKMYRDRFARSGLASSTKIDSKQLVVDGDLAYESGYAEIGTLKDGKVSINGGRFLTVWQRQTDGDWKILRNVVLP